MVAVWGWLLGSKGQLHSRDYTDKTQRKPLLFVATFDWFYWLFRSKSHTEKRETSFINQMMPNVL